MKIDSFLKTLRIIHGALCLGLLFCTAYAYYQNGSFAVTTSSDDLFVYLVPSIAILGYFASKFLYHKSLLKIKKETPLSQKTQAYLQANMIQYAILEGAGFFAIFAYFSSGNALFIVIALCLILYLYSRKPSAIKLKNELPLSLEDEKELKNLKPL